MNLLEQANERVVEINKAMGDIEKFESVVDIAKSSELSFYQNGAGTTHITVLSPEKRQELKTIVLDAITQAQAKKTAELEQLLGIEKRKPATINPVFEAAVQEMVKPQAVKPEYPKMTVELVKEFYHDKDMTLDQVAKEFGTNRTALYKFVSKNNLRKPNKRDKTVFRDTQVEKSRSKEPKPEKERP